MRIKWFLVRDTPPAESMFCVLEQTFYPLLSLVLVQHRKTRPNMAIKLLTGTKRINSNKTNYKSEIILIDFDTRKSYFVPSNNKRRRPACAFAQSGQRLCYSLYGKYNSPTSSVHNLVFGAEQACLWHRRQVFSRRGPYNKLYSKSITIIGIVTR